MPALIFLLLTGNIDMIVNSGVEHLIRRLWRTKIITFSKTAWDAASLFFYAFNWAVHELSMSQQTNHFWSKNEFLKKWNIIHLLSVGSIIFPSGHHHRNSASFSGISTSATQVKMDGFPKARRKIPSDSGIIRSLASLLIAPPESKVINAKVR